MNRFTERWSCRGHGKNTVIAKWFRDLLHPIRESFEGSVVSEPLRLQLSRVAKVLKLSISCLLLAITPIQRIKIRKELLGNRLHCIPRRVADYGAEAGAWSGEHIRELQLPMEEPGLLSQQANDLLSAGARL